MTTYVVRIAVQLDGHPPQAIGQFAEDMLTTLTRLDPAADMSGPDGDQYTFWTEVQTLAVESAVHEAVARLRAAANAAAGSTVGQVDHSVWPEYAAPASIEAHRADALAG